MDRHSPTPLRSVRRWHLPLALAMALVAAVPSTARADSVPDLGTPYVKLFSSASNPLVAFRVQRQGGTPKIVFELDREALVEMEVFSADGRRIGSYFHRVLPYGEHEYQLPNLRSSTIAYIHLVAGQDSYIFKALPEWGRR